MVSGHFVPQLECFHFLPIYGGYINIEFRILSKLGALVCEGVDDGKAIRVNVGSGLTDEQRDGFWQVKRDCIGMVAEVRADAITQNQDGTYSLRFPRFKGFRGFVAGEKI